MTRFHQQWIVAALAFAVLACNAGMTEAAEAKGIVTRVHPQRNEFVLTETFKDMTFQIDNTTRVLINGHISQIVDLREGDQATVSYERLGHLLIAGMVHVSRAPQPAQFPTAATLPRWKTLTAAP